MTNHWVDIKNADLVLIMGGNAAEAHPCGFKWVTEAKAHNKARLIVVDPRFTRSASVADYYCPIRQGTDIAFLNGLINYCISNDMVQWEYTKNFTNATYLVKEGFDYQDGLFTGYDETKRDYDRSTWDLNALAVVPRAEPPAIASTQQVADSTIPARIGSINGVAEADGLWVSRINSSRW